MKIDISLRIWFLVIALVLTVLFGVGKIPTDIYERGIWGLVIVESVRSFLVYICEN